MLWVYELVGREPVQRLRRSFHATTLARTHVSDDKSPAIRTEADTILDTLIYALRSGAASRADGIS